MCRLFGFRSVIQSQVHQSLVNADNALRVQSEFHPDGWGVAYYQGHSPHVIKTDKSALSDMLFKKVSGVVSSETVVAHIRKATKVENNILNTHPFQFGHWVFAHNGNIKNFDSLRKDLLKSIKPQLRRFILGDTDSELIFYFLLSELSEVYDLNRKDCPVDIATKSVKKSIKKLEKLIGKINPDDNAPPSETFATFILTNGTTMVAHQGGKRLFYSTYKTSCADKEFCSHYADVCENPTKDGTINHLIFTSEPLSGENIWLDMNPYDVVGVDWKMKLTKLD